MTSAADEVCGRTKGRSKHKETWWWNEEVGKAVDEKRRLYLVSEKSKELGKRNPSQENAKRTNEDKLAYDKAKRDAKKAVHKAQEAEREVFKEALLTAEEKGTVFRMARQMGKDNKDIVGGGCIKDSSGLLTVDEDKVREVWRAHFDDLLNVEFSWDKDSLVESDAISGPAECISKEEVRAAMAAMKVGKAGGPSGVVSEMLKAAGEDGVEWVTDLCNAVVREGKIPEDWKKSWLVTVYKGKGDALECGSYRGIKLLDHVMKVFERVIDKKIRSIVKLDDMQFGFTPGKSTTDAIFIVRQIQEKFISKKKDLWMAFVDLEKAFDRVPREVLWWALRRKGVDEWLVDVIKAMYVGATTAVRVNDKESAEFEVKVGVHQGSVLSPMLFIIVMDALSAVFRDGLPWKLLYADDLVLMADSESELLVKIARWKTGIEAKGLRVNMGKTKVMRCQGVSVPRESSGKTPCGICKKGVGLNSITCSTCNKWIHSKCSGLKGSLPKDNTGFSCPACIRGAPANASMKEVMVEGVGKLECVEKFCYLGDVIGDGGGAEDASRARVRCAWSKFRELDPILTKRGASLKVKGKIYRSCVQTVLVYGSETWAARAEEMQRLERTEKMMVRWMCGVSLKNQRERSISTENLRDRLGIDSVTDVVQRGRLRWFGHVERKSKDDWVSACRELEVDGRLGKGRPRKTWMECVVDDMRKVGLKREDAQFRSTWKAGIMGKASNPCKHGKATLK